jgi:hypothetical protein
MTGQPVAKIPPGLTLDAALAAMKGMSAAYPEHTLSLTNDGIGGMVIVHDPDATPREPAQGKRRRQRSTKAAATSGLLSVGKDEVGDLFAYAFHPTTKTEDGVKLIAAWMGDLLDSTEGAANYTTFTLDHPDGRRFALTVQRCGGLSPAQKIAELETQLAAATAEAGD